MARESYSPARQSRRPRTAAACIACAGVMAFLPTTTVAPGNSGSPPSADEMVGNFTTAPSWLPYLELGRVTLTVTVPGTLSPPASPVLVLLANDDDTFSIAACGQHETLDPDFDFRSLYDSPTYEFSAPPIYEFPYDHHTRTYDHYTETEEAVFLCHHQTS